MIELPTPPAGLRWSMTKTDTKLCLSLQDSSGNVVEGLSKEIPLERNSGDFFFEITNTANQFVTKYNNIQGAKRQIAINAALVDEWTASQ